MNLKRDSAARQRLAEWLEGQGLGGVSSRVNTSDHYLAACACALAAWKWKLGQTAWLHQATMPHHPYDFAC